MFGIKRLPKILYYFQAHFNMVIKDVDDQILRRLNDAFTNLPTYTRFPYIFMDEKQVYFWGLIKADFLVEN